MSDKLRICVFFFPVILIRFVATVNRIESVKKLRKIFKDLGGLGPTVEVRQADDNVKSVEECDVVLLW